MRKNSQNEKTVTRAAHQTLERRLIRRIIIQIPPTTQSSSQVIQVAQTVSPIPHPVIQVTRTVPPIHHPVVRKTVSGKDAIKVFKERHPELIIHEKNKHREQYIFQEKYTHEKYIWEKYVFWEKYIGYAEIDCQMERKITNEIYNKKSSFCVLGGSSLYHHILTNFSMMAKLVNSYLLRTFGITIDRMNSELNIITEKTQKCLRETFESESGKSPHPVAFLDIEQRINIAYNVAQILFMLESNGFLGEELKLAKFFWVERTLKFCLDYKSEIIVGAKPPLCLTQNPLYTYVSPNEMNDVEVDEEGNKFYKPTWEQKVYQYGIILFWLVTGEKPFEKVCFRGNYREVDWDEYLDFKNDIKNRDLLRQNQRLIDFVVPQKLGNGNKIPDGLTYLCKRCLDPNPKTRITISEIKSCFCCKCIY